MAFKGINSIVKKNVSKKATAKKKTLKNSCNKSLNFENSHKLIKSWQTCKTKIGVYQKSA